MVLTKEELCAVNGERFQQEHGGSCLAGVILCSSTCHHQEHPTGSHSSRLQ
jgi:hypothetical protein